MKNEFFEIEFDSKRGILTKLILTGDSEHANFIKNGHGLFEPHTVSFQGKNHDGGRVTDEEAYALRSFQENETVTNIVFARRGITISERFFFEGEYLKTEITVKNTNAYPFYFKREDFALYVPFADSYDSTVVCKKKRCHVHIADLGQASYIRTERMGKSEHNVGLVFVEGDVQSYSQEAANDNDRGFFALNFQPFSLLCGQETKIETVIFSHTGGDDFFEKAKKIKKFVRVECKQGFTLSIGETREILVTSGTKISSASAICDGKNLQGIINGNEVKFYFTGKKYGEKQINIIIDGKRTKANFFVSRQLDELVERRLKFIVNKQQCKDKKSPLYGAFLIYDNEEQRQYFSFDWSDHNACRERFGMAILLAKYLRTHQNEKFRAALDLFTEFLLREAFDAETFDVYNTIGKDDSCIRLYNAPWVALYFTELYFLDKKEEYAERIAKIMIKYYKNGGTKFYPNGIRFYDFAEAVKQSGRISDYKRMKELFDEHIDNLINNGTDYPPHEVNFEQTIVTPAMSLMLDQYRLTGDEKYLREAEKHLEILRKFDGAQPDCHRNKIPIRFWDDFWFGKEQSRVFGDTFPHYWSCLSGACYDSYGRLSGKNEWREYGKQTIENCFCLFGEHGEGFCAYVKPYRVNGKRGNFYDAFANDQDFALYFALRTQSDE